MAMKDSKTAEKQMRLLQMSRQGVPGVGQGLPAEDLYQAYAPAPQLRDDYMLSADSLRSDALIPTDPGAFERYVGRHPMATGIAMGNRFVEGDTGYAYEDLGDGSYAVFRDGVRTGTARRGSRAADSIASVIAGGKALPVRRGPSAMDILQSERFTQHEAFQPEGRSSAPYRGELTAQYETAALRNKG